VVRARDLLSLLTDRRSAARVLGWCAALLAVLALGGSSYVVLSGMSERAHREQAAADHLTQVSAALARQSLLTASGLAAGSATPRQLTVIAAERRQARAALARASRAAFGGDRSGGYVGLRTRLDVFERAVDGTLALLGDHRGRLAVQSAARGVSTAEERLQLALRSSAGDERADALATHERFSRWLRVTMALAVLIALLLGGGLAWLQRARRQALRRFRALVQNLNDVVAVVDRIGRVLFVTDAAERMLGYRATDLVGEDLLALVPAGARETLRTMVANAGPVTGPIKSRISARDGRAVDVEIAVSDLTAEEAVRGVALTLHDVTDRTRLENELRHRAFHDALTELPNRALFEDRVSHALDRASRDATTVAVCFLDLDDFKAVNDSLGHSAGDRFLIAAAERLRGCLRTEDTAARLGGDEFAVLVEGLAGPEGAERVAQQLLGALADSVKLDGQELFVRASIGVATSGPGQQDVEQLLRDADTAMYVAKRNGKRHYHVFDPQADSWAGERPELQLQLEAAVARGEIKVAYQPIVDITNSRIVGVEALARWTPPGAKPVSPSIFIPIAERNGLIVELGRRVLREACGATARWQQHDPRLMLTVNVSSRQLKADDFVAQVAAALSDSGLAADRLTLELTEWVLADDSDATLETLRQLKALGLSLAVDDFGTGYSSLGYLSRFPIDLLKLDRSLITTITTDERQLALVRGITALAEDLGLSVLAEGVERPDQLEPLRGMHCQLGQGFHFAKPREPAAIEALLSAAARPEDVNAASYAADPAHHRSQQALRA